jgi:hypothetical protein
MSRISPDFIHSVGCLYEEMNIQDQDFLNENSEYYDAEMSYLVEDILSTISTSMIYEGYSASAIIGFLADSSTQDILEKYLTFDENILLENTISEEYIQEQLEIFDYCIDEGLAGKLLGGAIKLAGRVASKPARSAVAKKLATSANPEKTRAAMQRLAQREARKGNVGGYSKTQSPIDGGKPMSGKQSAELLTKAKLGQVTQKVKDIASKAKTVLPKVAKGLGIFGLGAAGGYMGAKLAGGGGDGKVGPKIVGPKIVGPKIVGPKSSSPSDGGGGSNSSGAAGGGGSSTPSSGSPKPAPAKPAAAKPTGTPMQQWAKANPTLAAKVKPGQSGYSEISALRDKPSSYEKQDQTPTTGKPEAQIDTKSIEVDIKKEQDRLKKKAEETKTTKESYDAYEVVLEYLISTEQVETLDEAHYVMLEMDAETIGDIVEAKYGTAKGRKKLAKKVRAGKDVGKKGDGFEEIVSKSAPKYGKERATKIAAAAMWKNLGK